MLHPSMLHLAPVLLAAAAPARATAAPLTSAAPARVAAAALTPVAAAPAAPSICQATAGAARQAARRQAQADYWIAVAKCLNAPDSCECEDEAEDALEQALDEADDQHAARLQACQLLGQGAYNPHVDPDDFSADVTNTYFPLVPGRTLVYQKTTAGGVERLVSTTLEETVEIGGVECRQLHEVETLDDETVEDTIDFFAQKENGNVFYFGEVTQVFEDGFLESLGGSWRFGKDGAKPGIQMLGNPRVQDAYRQEFLIGEAEDIGKVVAVDQTVQVPAGTFQHCVKTRDWTPIEPGNFEFKYYAPGVGLVLEVDPANGERLELHQILD